jgi:hypothetical protein
MLSAQQHWSTTIRIIFHLCPPGVAAPPLAAADGAADAVDTTAEISLTSLPPGVPGAGGGDKDSAATSGDSRDSDLDESSCGRRRRLRLLLSSSTTSGSTTTLVWSSSARAVEELEAPRQHTLDYILHNCFDTSNFGDEI